RAARTAQAIDDLPIADYQARGKDRAQLDDTKWSRAVQGDRQGGDGELIRRAQVDTVNLAMSGNRRQVDDAREEDDGQGRGPEGGAHPPQNRPPPVPDLARRAGPGSSTGFAPRSLPGHVPGAGRSRKGRRPAPGGRAPPASGPDARDRLAARRGRIGT